MMRSDPALAAYGPQLAPTAFYAPGVVADASIDNSSAINAAIAALPPNGGTIVLPAGVIGVSSPILALPGRHNVRLVGQGAGHWHDIGNNTDGTALKWIGPSGGGPIVRMAAYAGSGNQCLVGGGLADLTLDCNNLAANALEIVSQRIGMYTNVTVRNPLAWGITTDTCLLGEAAGVHGCRFDTVIICTKDGLNGGGVLLGGHDAGAGLANTSHCTFTNCWWTHNGLGNGLKIVSGDNNRFLGLSILRVTGSSPGVLFVGAQSKNNYFYHLDPGAGQIAEISGAHDDTVLFADTINYGGMPTGTGLHYYANGVIP